MFRLQNVRHTYADGPTVVLPDAEAEQGEHWLVLGLSGSGKSTMLHVLGGLLRPQAGRVVVAQQDLGALKGGDLDRFRGRHIGIVFQRMHLVGTLTVEQNLLLAQYLAGLQQEPERARAVLDRLAIADRAGAYPHALSYGQQQRVAIARAVMNRPRVLLADEPTSSLDDVRSTAVLDLLEEQAEAEGATLVIATHDRRVRARLGRQLVLGTLAADAPEAAPAAAASAAASAAP